MVEEIDVTSLVKERKITTKTANRVNTTLKVVIAGGLAIALTAATVTVLVNFFKTTDFSEDVPLAENVSRWDNLQLEYGNNVTQIVNKYGTWEDATNSGVFRNETNGCYIRLIPAGIPGDKMWNDADETANHGEAITEGKGVKKSTVWLPVDGETGKVEFASSYIAGDSTRDPGYLYYRSFSQASLVHTILLSCEDTDLLDKVATENTNQFNLGVSLKLVKD